MNSSAVCLVRSINDKSSPSSSSSLSDSIFESSSSIPRDEENFSRIVSIGLLKRSLIFSVIDVDSSSESSSSSSVEEGI